MILDYLRAHIVWSRKTFGEGRKTKSITAHIEKEIVEILKKPTDLIEWVDTAILGFDGAWRAGHTPEHICAAILDSIELGFVGTWQSPEVITGHMLAVLKYIEQDPDNLEGWVNIILFSLRGALRMKFSVLQIFEGLRHKQSINFARKWQIPEDENAPIEHIREEP